MYFISFMIHILFHLLVCSKETFLMYCSWITFEIKLDWN